MHLPARRTPLLLELDLTHPPVTTGPDDLLGRIQARSRTQLRPLLRALHEAGADARVRGLVVKVGGALPWAMMQEIRRGVQAFAERGKPTVAWAESFAESDTSSYVLATAFHEIWLQPGGALGVLGVGLETTFLRGALDKLGIEPQFEQRHEYKNAVDRITRTDFTPAHREALDTVAGSLFDAAVDDIAHGRRLSRDTVMSLIDTGPRSAVEAHRVGLVDRLGYRDEAYAAVRTRIGAEVDLLFADQWKPARALHRPERRHVALVEVHGGIASGRSRRSPLGRQVGSDTVTAALRAALDDDKAAAVVLHVDSPGGSAVASEAIWREVCRLRDAGKPVVVSMGALAASGGYYVACPADVIVALPATLTGSIGVFGGKLVTTDLLERLGLHTGTVQRGDRALMFSPRRGFSDDERLGFAATVDAIYTDFVAKVAAGRGRPVEVVEPLARGRVWTGRDAMDVGLVDELGGLRDAVRIARQRSGLPTTAKVRPAVHVAPMQKLGRAKNSEDPRAATAAATAALAGPDLRTAIGLPALDELLLRMPELRIR